MLGRLKRALKREEGQALVEFALVMPILLLVILGIIDFGRAINYWNSENSLANVAARYVSVGTLPTPPPCGTAKYGTTETITTYMQCALLNQYGITTVASGNGLTTASMTYCISVPTDTAGQPVTVKITGSYNWLPFLKKTSAKITGSATMPLENTVSSSMYTQTTTCT